jgi:hypothetical protein
MTVAAFSFQASDHTYRLNGTIVPSITQLLTAAGLIREANYDAKSAERGSLVHRLCTELDLGAIEDVKRLDSPVKGWIQGYALFTQTVRPAWTVIEEAKASPKYRFGGRVDRLGAVYSMESIVELKSGACERWHGVQTALQDILWDDLRPGIRQRWGLYLKRTGKFRLIPHDGSDPSCSQGRADYDQAYDLLQRFAR